MKRREFITLIGGAAAAYPFATRAQQPVPVVGFLDSGAPAGITENLAACHPGLAEAGLAKGNNLAID